MAKLERKTKIYGHFIVSASTMYINDQRKMEKQGWRVVSATEIGKRRLNVIYERGGELAHPELGVANLQLLLSKLSPNERIQFESEVQQIINQWLSRKN